LAVQSRSFGQPNPARHRRQEGNQVFRLNTEALGTPPPRIAPFFTQPQPRTKSHYNSEANTVWQSNLLTSVPVEVIRRFIETPPPRLTPYTVALSLVRGQAGASGATPPDTSFIFRPLPSSIDRRADYYPPGSIYWQIVERVGYDPAGGGAFFNTPPRSKYFDARADASGFLRAPQIALVEADLPLRHWVDIPVRPGIFNYPLDNSSIRLRQLLDPTTVGEGTTKVWITGPAWKQSAGYIVDVSQVRMTATGDITPGSGGGYDIYHYYVG
jgi:hypothetical protein